MFYTIYKTTNLLNNKIYIGKHQTNDTNDVYLGSGKNLQKAINKYGKVNFKKEILFIFESEQEMNDKEKEIVTPEFCERKDTYNITPGYGGFYHINNENKDFYIEKARKTVESFSSEKKKEISMKKARYGDKNGMYGIHRYGEDAPMYGKKQTEYNKQRTREANTGRIPTKAQRIKVGVKTKKRFEIPGEKERHGLKLKAFYINNTDKKLAISEQIKKLKWFNDGTISKRYENNPDANIWKPGRIKWRIQENIE